MHIRCFKPCVVVNEGKISADFSTQLADKTTVHKGKQNIYHSDSSSFSHARRSSMPDRHRSSAIKSRQRVSTRISTLPRSKSDTSRCVTPAFCASSLCVMPLSRRLALSHTETAGGVRSIIVVLVEISMKKYPFQYIFVLYRNEYFSKYCFHINDFRVPAHPLYVPFVRPKATCLF